MIPRLNRLPTTRLISSKVISSDFFTLRYVKNDLSYNRFAFVVGKKIDKKAVVRNRLKRVLREIAYTKSLSFPRGVDMLFLVKKNFQDIPYQQMEKEVEKIFGFISA